MRFASVLLVCLVGLAGCDKLNLSGPSPVVTAFFADSASVKAGVGTVLHWETANGETATLTPLVGSVPLSGARAVSPAVSTVYTLTVTSSDGVRQAAGTVSVTVTP
jgi:hypothetical protein